MSRRDHAAERADLQINESLRAAAERMGYKFEPPDTGTPASALMAREEFTEDPDEWQIRVEAFNAILGFFFAKGPHPADVMVQVYAAAKTYRPELILNATCADLANIFGDTKAAWSWRCKNFSRAVAKTGALGTSTGFQKAPSSSRVFAASQKGNTNRRGKRSSRKR